MIRQRHLITLLKAGLAGDAYGVNRLARELRSELSLAGNTATVNQIDRLLTEIKPVPARTLASLPDDVDRLGSAGNTIWWQEPRRSLATVELEPDARKEIEGLLRDAAASERLIEYGLKPRTKLMLTGDSGTGKTCTAEAIATELERPFGIVRIGQVMDSHLGCTSKNLDRVADCLTQPCVMLFDECDSLFFARGAGKTACDAEETRIVGTLLTMIERLPPHVVFIAATNHPEHCDKAFNRRFDAVVKLEPPSAAMLFEFSRRFASKWSDIGVDLDLLSLGATYATAERAILNAARDAVLAIEEVASA